MHRKLVSNRTGGCAVISSIRPLDGPNLFEILADSSLQQLTLNIFGGRYMR